MQKPSLIHFVFIFSVKISIQHEILESIHILEVTSQQQNGRYPH